MSFTENAGNETGNARSVEAAAFRPGERVAGCAPGRVRLNPERLQQLRGRLLLSQQELAAECWRRRLRLSLASIKRAEGGQPVLFRTARELSRLYGTPIEELRL